MTQTRRTRRWRGVVAVALLAAAVGLVADRSELLLLSVVGVLFAAYPSVTGTPDPSLSLDRRVSDQSPAPGDEVEVTTTVTNEGDRTLTDLRIVDGVPPALTVADGSPRRGLVVRPGSERSFSYTVKAESGMHQFGPATAVARNLSGSVEVETQVSTDTTVDCTTDAAGRARSEVTLDRVGRVRSDHGGAGIEFHRTREYQRGDPLGRIDWKRYASSGDLTTVEFHEERATSVVLLVDARRNAYRATGSDAHAVVHSVSATRQLASGLAERRNRVGLAAVGREFCWLAPSLGREHRLRIEEQLSTHPAFLLSPPDEDTPLDEQVETLTARMPSTAQLVVLTPLLDDDIVGVAQQFEARSHPVTVVTPDVTSTDSPGKRLATIERENRLSTLRRANIPVVDWDPSTPLELAFSATANGGYR